ncbi:MAG TPA: acyl-CoA synthetase [Longimicrobiales bacterium]|nr:acyl-CoA synthetase [Longimicrobiales bacterium]
MPESYLERARGHGGRIALMTPARTLTYGELVSASVSVAREILAAVAGTRRRGSRSPVGLDGAPVAFLCPQSWEYAAVQWGVWAAGGMAVPLSPVHPEAELSHVLDDAGPAVVVTHPNLRDRVDGPAGERGIPVLGSGGLLKGPSEGRGTDGGGPLPAHDPDRPALMLYTSGTTGRPKGVVLTHGNLEAQVRSMVEAWEWTAEDRILTHLPLHHVHGIVNVLVTALWCGATCEMLPAFDAVTVWERLAERRTTLYMAVPTVYRRLLDAWDSADAATRARWAAGAQACRLMVSGSAALPVPTLERWEAVTGHRLLERYGMTEIGMALSNPLRGERRPGFVGAPLPGVEARLVDEGGDPAPDGAAGEIQVRGPTVFREYWRRPGETAAAFAPGGWFRTGDLAMVEDGAFRILGRMSQDILKTGGEKVSALEIEDALRTHPGVADCAVVGVPDPAWGERVCGAVVLRDGSGAESEVGSPPTPEKLRAFARERLAPYKVPKEIRIVDELPRNAMGKVTKGAVRALFEGTAAPSGGDA